MKKRGLRFLVLTCVTLLSMVWLTDISTAQEKIRIGAAVSMTGRLAREGSLVKKGYDTWAEWVNGRGGITVGKKPLKVEMVYYDDKADATTSAKLTEKLITEDKVNLILGPYSSGIVAATSAIGEKYGYVTIGPMSNGDFIFERGFKYLFSVLPPGSDAIALAPEMVVKLNPKPKTFASAVLDHFFTLPAIDGIRKKSTGLGLQEVYYGKYAPNTTDFSSILTAIKSNNPDLIYFGGFFQDNVAFFRQAKENNVNAKMYVATAGPAQPDWIEVMKKDGDYVVTNTMFHPNLQNKGRFFASTKAYDDFWKQKYGDDPDNFSSCGFVTGILVQLAIEKAGSLDQNKIRDALRVMDVETFFGKFKFDEKGRNIGGRECLLQLQKEKHVLVYPEWPGAKVMYPAPAWKDR